MERALWCHLQRTEGGNEMGTQILHDFRLGQAGGIWPEILWISRVMPVWSAWQPVVKYGIQHTSIWSLPCSRRDSYSSMNDTSGDKCLLCRLSMSCPSAAAASSRQGQEPDLPAIAAFSHFPLTVYSNSGSAWDRHEVQLILLLVARSWGSNRFQEVRVASGKRREGCQKMVSF